MSEVEVEKPYEFTKGKVVYCVSVDTHEEPNLVKTMKGNTLNIAMIRSLMTKGVSFLAMDTKGNIIQVVPAGLESIKGLEGLPEFDI